MTVKTLVKDLALTSIGVGALTFIALSPVLAHAAEVGTSAAPVIENVVQTNQTISTGSFDGRSRYKTSGDVSIIKTATGYELVLSDNFSMGNAPTPVLGFGKNGKYDTASTFSQLNKIEGRQTYTLPNGISLAGYNEVFVWCEEFSVPLGVAKLTQS